MPPSRTLSTLVLLAVSLVSGCEHGGRDADPYAARYLVEKPPYVRTAHATTPASTDVARDPEFTDAQAASGAAVYARVCARCHASSQWQGGTFAASWRDRRLSDFYDLVSQAMPQDAPGTLTTEQYVDVTAYVMQLAGFRGGPSALSADTATTRHERLHMAPADTFIRTPVAAPSGPAGRGKGA